MKRYPYQKELEKAQDAVDNMFEEIWRLLEQGRIVEARELEKAALPKLQAIRDEKRRRVSNSVRV